MPGFWFVLFCGKDCLLFRGLLPYAILLPLFVTWEVLKRRGVERERETAWYSVSFGATDGAVQTLTFVRGLAKPTVTILYRRESPHAWPPINARFFIILSVALDALHAAGVHLIDNLQFNCVSEKNSSITTPLPPFAILREFECFGVLRGIPYTHKRTICFTLFFYGENRAWIFVFVQALMGKKVAHVACGGFHSAAILESGELYTWGGGEHGQVIFVVVLVSFVLSFLVSVFFLMVVHVLNKGSQWFEPSYLYYYSIDRVV